MNQPAILGAVIGLGAASFGYAKVKQYKWKAARVHDKKLKNFLNGLLISYLNTLFIQLGMATAP